MKPSDLNVARKQRGWSQKEAASRLGVSQPYLSMLENGRRPLSPALAEQLMRVYDLPATVLPLGDFVPRETLDAQALAEDVAKLGYPGLAYLRSQGRPKNPAEVLLGALACRDLEPRLTEALPWLLLRYMKDMDTSWLVKQARLHNLQNRLAFVAGLARRAAESLPQFSRPVQLVRQLEGQLQPSRLAVEDTLCQASLPRAKHQWLMTNRPPEAAYWNLLTDWRPEHLRYFA
ncbi:MAG: helix-turn-helix transcriptional regulator [Acidobacteria bacterium]|nr:helix-turn-helix transcriptional regulator [Acidobacteriota bacterium]